MEAFNEFIVLTSYEVFGNRSYFYTVSCFLPDQYYLIVFLIPFAVVILTVLEMAELVNDFSF